MLLRGKRVVISAAASGIGRAGCQLFAKHGAVIAAIDINPERLMQLEADIQAIGGQCRVFIADLSKAKECYSTSENAAEWLGGIDVLWNHAGSVGFSAIEKVDPDLFTREVNLTLGSAVYVTAAALENMGRGGSIIFTSSVSGLVASPRSPIYAALKFGIVGYMKSVALRLAERGIRANALCPGPIDTHMLDEALVRKDESGDLEQKRLALIQSLPTGRVGMPFEVANAALWLASDASSHVTGITLPIDGGLSAR